MYTDIEKSVDKTFAKVDRSDTHQVDSKSKQPLKKFKKSL